MKTIPLRHLATVTNSNVDKVTHPDELPVRLCNYVDVYKNERITSDMDFMAASATPTEIARFMLRVGDVVITKDSEDRNDIAVPAYVSETASDLVCGYHLALLRARSSLIRGDFLFWAIQSKQAREAFSVAAGGITRFGLTLDGIKSVALPRPDLEIQKAIADFLDNETARIDQMIEKKLDFVSALWEREESSTRQLLSGEVCEAHRRIETSAPWLQLVPDHWKIIPLRHLVKISTGGRDTQDRTDDGAYPFYVRSMNVERIDTYSYNEEAVLTSGDGAGVGKIFHHVHGKFELHQRMYAFTKFKQLSGRYFFHFLRAFFHLQMTQWSAKSTVDSVRMPFLKSMVFAVPPLPEQEVLLRRIDASIERTSRIIDATEQSAAKLREFRAALITAAVTGQIDATTWNKEGQAARRLDQIEEEIASAESPLSQEEAQA